MKRPIIDDDLSEMVQHFANHETNGNFTEAVDTLCRSALFNFKVRDIGDTQSRINEVSQRQRVDNRVRN